MRATSSIAVGAALPELRAVARNVHAAQGKGRERNIHNDEAAATMGFQRGLVAGGQSIALLTRVAIAFFGASYFTTGRLTSRFVRPVYDGDAVTVTGVVRSVEPEGDGVRVTCDLWLSKADGAHAVTALVSAIVSSP